MVTDNKKTTPDSKKLPEDHKRNVSVEGQDTAGQDKMEDAYEFSDINNPSDSETPGNIGFILDIPLEITAVLGETRMVINELLQLGQGSVIELSKIAGSTLEVLANQRLIARGEVVVTNEKYGIRITEIVSPTERIQRLR